jgi:hypothetical protein
MEISISSLLKDLPDRPIEPRSASLPRYINNDETRQHLLGRRISTAVLKLELERHCLVWAQVQTECRRDAVYDFLEAAYGVVGKFNRSGQAAMLLRKLHRVDPALTRIHEPYAAIIHHGTGYGLDIPQRLRRSRRHQS